MKVILKQKYETLGDVAEIVNVKDGYARNFLIPKGIALEANKRNLKIIEQEKKRLQAIENRIRREAEQLAEKLSSVSVTAEVQVGEEDRVFGAVTSQDIAELLKNKGFDIDRRKILMEEPLKALGVYEVPIKLHPDVEAKIKVWVVKQG
ncbi:MAG: 50S ribosomal protein L9 [candidate division KSB1 bacterium]|nr:50S ribosomal protein L9 [candidate division KSB1 bacterium]